MKAANSNIRDKNGKLNGLLHNNHEMNGNKNKNKNHVTNGSLTTNGSVINGIPNQQYKSNGLSISIPNGSKHTTTTTTQQNARVTEFYQKISPKYAKSQKVITKMHYYNAPSLPASKAINSNSNNTGNSVLNINTGTNVKPKTVSKKPNSKSEANKAKHNQNNVTRVTHHSGSRHRTNYHHSKHERSRSSRPTLLVVEKLDGSAQSAMKIKDKIKGLRKHGCLDNINDKNSLHARFMSKTLNLQLYDIFVSELAFVEKIENTNILHPVTALKYSHLTKLSDIIDISSLKKEERLNLDKYSWNKSSYMNIEELENILKKDDHCIRVINGTSIKNINTNENDMMKDYSSKKIENAGEIADDRCKIIDQVWGHLVNRVKRQDNNRGGYFVMDKNESDWKQFDLIERNEYLDDLYISKMNENTKQIEMIIARLAINCAIRDYKIGLHIFGGSNNIGNKGDYVELVKFNNFVKFDNGYFDPVKNQKMNNSIVNSNSHHKKHNLMTATAMANGMRMTDYGRFKRFQTDWFEKNWDLWDPSKKVFHNLDWHCILQTIEFSHKIRKRYIDETVKLLNNACKEVINGIEVITKRMNQDMIKYNELKKPQSEKMKRYMTACKYHIYRLKLRFIDLNRICVYNLYPLKVFIQGLVHDMKQEMVAENSFMQLHTTLVKNFRKLNQNASEKISKNELVYNVLHS